MSFTLNPHNHALPSVKSLIIPKPNLSRPTPTLDLLNKRNLPIDPQAIQLEITKKLKAGTLDNPSLTALALGQTLPMDFMMNPMAQMTQKIHAMRQMQMMMDVQSQLMSIQNLGLLSKTTINPVQELNKTKPEKKTVEEIQALTKPSTPNTEEKMSEKSATTPKNKEICLAKAIESPVEAAKTQCTGPVEGEPELSELTRNYPDWDLATIFEFMRSGKSEAEFEKDRQVKLSQKRGRQAKKAALAQKKAKLA